jgi:hypothetical protein
MATEPKRKEPEIKPPRPDVQPERTPSETPQDKDTSEKEMPPTQFGMISADTRWCQMPPEGSGGPVPRSATVGCGTDN